MASYPESFPGLLEEYLTFLQHHRGLREATLYFHRRWGEQFLHHLAEHLPDRDLARLTIPIVDAFVLPLARTVGRGTQWQIIQTVRGVLRHLHRTARVAEDWSRFVHGPRRYRLASIPTTISVDEVRCLLTTIDRRSAIGRRDYAILLLLAVYGLRAQEVVDLGLNDVDWRAGIIRVQRSKTSRPLVLPLTSAIGHALVAYLRRGRPRTDSRQIFVCHNGAPRPFRKSSNVYRIVRLAFDRAGICSARRGPHVLRHALRHTSSSADSPSRSSVTCLGISIPIQLCHIRNSRSRISEKSHSRSRRSTRGSPGWTVPRPAGT